ncbi:MAG: hypothetical protein ACKOBR_12110, partial [Actinomycetota bacterium]
MHLGAPMLSVTGGLEGAVLEVLAGTDTPLPLGNVHRLIHSASKSGVRKALLRLADGGVVTNQFPWHGDVDSLGGADGDGVAANV